jgi:hypothetical protein
MGYDPAKRAAVQSSVPSQEMPVPPPFDSIRQPDIQSIPPNVIDFSLVQSVYDARPPKGFDFFWEDAFLVGISQTNGYTVPPGYVLVLKQIFLATYPAFTVDDHHNHSIDVYGASFDEPGAFNLLIDGQSCQQFTLSQGQPGVILFDIGSSDVQIDCYVVVAQGQNINIRIPTYTDDDSTNVLVHYYGNYLLATGRNILNEPGNPRPILVEEFTGEIRR